MKKRVVVVGGTGFLGQHICRELDQRGYDVTSIGLVCDVLARTIKQRCRDIDVLKDKQLEELFEGATYAVYALGPDDRSEVSSDQTVTEYYHRYLVDRTIRVAKAARKAGVKRMVVLGSYFAYVDRVGCEGLAPYSLAPFHPYIQARVDQEEALGALKDIETVVLEIPYVLGSTPGAVSALQTVFSRYQSSPYVIFGRGGTTVISVNGVARSVAAALTHGRSGDCLAIGSKNMTFRELFDRLLRESNSKKRFAAPPTWVLSLMLHMQYMSDVLRRRKSGLDYRYLAKDILRHDFFVDFTTTNQTLGISVTDDIDKALKDTARELRA